MLAVSRVPRLTSCALRRWQRQGLLAEAITAPSATGIFCPGFSDF
ncbi:hypothetical protein A2U01_0053966, partial [Trifolium medium]|nr:hypothetical protein [Trifolium medium]